MANFVIKRNGTDITDTIQWQSIDNKNVLTKEVSTLQFTIEIPLGNATTSLPQLGDTIDLYDQASNHIFGGILTDCEMTVPNGGLNMEYQLTATDWGFLLDSKLVNKTYAAMDPADILADIIANYAQAGFNATTYVTRGNFLITTLQFNQMPVTKAIQKLAQTIDWEWFVDANKNIWFFDGAVDDGSGAAVGDGHNAPFNIDLTSGNIIKDSLDITQTIKNLKNSVYVIGGTKDSVFTAITTPDVYTSVAGQLVYSLGYQYDESTITVTLNGVAQSVGPLNQSNIADYQVLYQSGKPPFIQFVSDPGSGNTIKIFGTASIPIVAHVTNPASIATYGEIQDVITDTQILSTNQAIQRAQADLLQYGHAVYDVKFNTRTPGLAVGQTIMMTLPTTGFAVTNYALVIKSVEAVGYTPTKLLWQVEAIGSDVVTYTDIMTTLLLQEQTSTDTSNTVLQEVFSFAEPITLADVLTVTPGTRPYTWGQTLPSLRWGFFTWD